MVDDAIDLQPEPMEPLLQRKRRLELLSQQLLNGIGAQLPLDFGILIAGPTFRTARFIFNNLEKMVESKGAELLAQAFGAKQKRNDQFEWQINGGSITAIPLNGEKIRGFRANILVLDE